MTCSDCSRQSPLSGSIRPLSLEARTVGPAARAVLARPHTRLSVHSVFRSTANLAVEGSDILVSLTGPAGANHPQAVALGSSADFGALQLAAGDTGRVGVRSLSLETREGLVSVDLGAAARPARNGLPKSTALDKGGAFRACVLELAEFQASVFSDLRVQALLGPSMSAVTTSASLGESVCRSARDLLAEIPASSPTRFTIMSIGETISRRVSALLGAGRGLTPCGDDFLCGFLAAARAAAPAGALPRLASRRIDEVMCSAIRENIAATGEISATFLLLAVRGFWPGPLAALARGLAAGDKTGALAALDELFAFGHSSGADIATGFLTGHHAFHSLGGRHTATAAA